ncbi:MAG: DNA adenine methylase, partial [Candidatus Ranarchaeia archaeon]
MVEPILKWAGGKRSIVQEIFKLFPADSNKRPYHEPFLGGGAVFFRLEPCTGTINDLNRRLINFYKVVRDHPDRLISQAKSYVNKKENYYELRDTFNNSTVSPIEEAA